MIFLKSGSNPNNKYTVTLDDRAYDIYLRYNERDESWQISLALSGQKIFMTSKVTTMSDFLQPFRYKPECPRGVLFVVDLVATYGRVDFESFDIGKRFTLTYVDNVPSMYNLPTRINN